MAATPNAPAASYDPRQTPTLFGHPTGLYTLFFAEMWERFSFYGMRALLVFYMTKGFLGYADKDAYAVYGAYTALVYMTPFFGGILADRLLGARRAVILGGILMALGQCLLMMPSSFAFFSALALLICGNGFFKPNISTIVGSLYPPGSKKRDGGFTIFYMGINLGAAMSPLLCGYIGETIDWRLGFGLATLGMLIGLAVFVAPTRVTQAMILAGAIAASFGLVFYHPADFVSIGVNIFVAIALLIAGGVAWLALGRGGIPAEAGLAPHPERLRKPLLGPIRTDMAIYLGSIAAVLLFAFLVSGFSIVTKRPVALIPEGVIESMQANANPLIAGSAELVEAISRPAGIVLILSFAIAGGYIIVETFRLPTIPRQRMYVVLILTAFSFMFFAFFEQAGSSINNFTDRNIDRVPVERYITQADVGKTIEFRIETNPGDAELAKLPLLSQQQLGYYNGNPTMEARIEEAVLAVAKKKDLPPEKVNELVNKLREYDTLTLTALTNLRDAAKDDAATPAQKRLSWTIVEPNIGMGISETELAATAFQAANPVFILILGLVFSAAWTWMGSRGMEPSTTVKFSLGLLLLGLGFVAFWYGARIADDRGMVAMQWLLLGYLLHTCGELCLSPVGLSMITKLSPARLVATVMGVWFLASAASQYLAAIIAQFTSVGSVVPPPIKTVHVYGDVFGKIALCSIVMAAVCFALAPVLNRWMHPEEQS